MNRRREYRETAILETRTLVSIIVYILPPLEAEYILRSVQSINSEPKMSLSVRLGSEYAFKSIQSLAP
jgi:hypothetical protein